MNNKNLETLYNIIPNFNEEYFVNEIFDKYILYKDYVKARDYEKLKESVEDYSSSNLTKLVSKDRTHECNKFNLENYTINYVSDNNEETTIKFSFTIKGTNDSNDNIFIFYNDVTFVKKKHVEVKCANCGSVLKENSKKCEYCGTLVNQKENKWLVRQDVNKKTILNDTNVTQRASGMAVAIIVIAIIFIFIGLFVFADLTTSNSSFDKSSKLKYITPEEREAYAENISTKNVIGKDNNLYIFVTNNNKVGLTLSINTILKDNNNSLKDTCTGFVNFLPANSETVVVCKKYKPEDINIENEVKVSLIDYYENKIDDLSVTPTYNKDKNTLIIQYKNEGKTIIQKYPSIIIYYNNNDIIGSYSMYNTSLFENKTETKSIYISKDIRDYPGSFDDYKIYTIAYNENKKTS